MQKLHQFTLCTSRQENVSLQVAGRGLLVYCDGQGFFTFLKADGNPLDASAWRVLYECEPIGLVSTLLLGATFDDATQRFHVFATELIDYNDKDAVYRLHVVDVFSAAVDNPMDVDIGAVVVGLEHTATEIAVVASLPSYVSFTGSELLLLVEGKHELMVELAVAPLETKPPAEQPMETEEEAHTTAHKRHHDESDFDDELGELLAKLPRAGIGYHGDISGLKQTHELALDLGMPLEERFHKSSTPYSTLDEPLHSAPDGNARNIAERNAREGKLEVPTSESMLGGFEECDDVDPNATAAILRVSLKPHEIAVLNKYDVNCRKFRFLCQSARVQQPAQPTFLFQYDVHGLVFDAAPAQLALTHRATLPAFGFVQASKQQKKFMTLHPSGAFACIGEFEKRIFVYHGAAKNESELKSHTRQQNVVELGDHQLLGMRITNDATVLVLTPHHVVAITVPV